MEGEVHIGLLLVSHSLRIAEGVAELVVQVAGPDVEIVALGGGSDGNLGTDGAQILEGLKKAATGAGAVVLMDLGSAVLAVRSALNELGDDASQRLVPADAPFVEGAIAAGVAASTGASLEDVRRAAEEARHSKKL